MYIIISNTDPELVSFINDYVEQKLDPIEESAFKEYIRTDDLLSSYVRKSKQGKQALAHAYRVEAADDFEEKLARRIAKEKQGNDCASLEAN